MTFLNLLTALGPAMARLPVASAAPAPRGHVLVRVDNRHGVPATYEWSKLRPSGRLASNNRPGFRESDRLLGVPSLRTLRIPIDATGGSGDHLLTIRANGRTAKLLLYGESVADSLRQGKSPSVWVRIGSSGAVRFEVR
jgi:hypothetical protein